MNYVKTWTEQTFYKSGALSYQCTWAILTTEGSKLAKVGITAPDGTHRIRIGGHIKLHEDGQIAWELTHDALGNVTHSRVTR